MQNGLSRIKDFFLKYEQKMVLIVAFCLIAAISYEFGVLQGQKWQQKPLIIEQPINIPAEQTTANTTDSTTSGAIKAVTISAAAGKNPIIQNAANCAYVGSKSSTKFYLPTCQWAKSIKPENLVCFQSAQQAIGQGRTESKCTK